MFIDKVAWPGGSEGTFRSSSQAATLQNADKHKHSIDSKLLANN